MAERWAVQTGLWSSTSTWNGGTLPSTGDDVHANGFTVTIDQNVQVLSLRTTAGATPVAGGLFAATSSSNLVTITADVIAGSSRCLNLQYSHVLNGNSSGGSVASAYGVQLTLGATHNGNSTGGSNSTGYGTYISAGGKQNGNASGSVGPGSNCAGGGVFNGNTTGGSVTNAFALDLRSGGIHIGDSTGGSASGAYGTRLEAGAKQYGNATGGSASGAHGSYLNAAAIFLGGTATGNTSGAYGVLASEYAIAIIQQSVGSYASSLNVNTRTTNEYVPFYETLTDAERVALAWSHSTRTLT